MGCITSMLYLMILPIIICFYLFKIIVLFFWEIIKFIISFLDDMAYNSSNYSFKKPYNHNKKKTKINKKTGYKDAEFEEQANLWGLSKEDKQLAKQERMSPANFIEAEERDDDELVTDEWE